MIYALLGMLGIAAVFFASRVDGLMRWGVCLFFIVLMVTIWYANETAEACKSAGGVSHQGICWNADSFKKVPR